MGRGGIHRHSSSSKRPCKFLRLYKACLAQHVWFGQDTPLTYCEVTADVAAAAEALPGNDGAAHGTRVPRIQVLSVKWDLLSTVVLTRYIPALRLAGVGDMVFGERFDDRARAVWRGRTQWHVWSSATTLTRGSRRRSMAWPARLEQITFGSA